MIPKSLKSLLGISSKISPEIDSLIKLFLDSSDIPNCFAKKFATSSHVEFDEIDEIKASFIIF